MDGSDSVLAQVHALCEAHPQTPTSLLVPRRQIGRALENAVARKRGRWGGLDSSIVRHYAEAIARPTIAASGRTECPVDGRLFLVDRLLRDHDADALLGDLPGAHQMAPTVAEAIETLRLAGAARAPVRRRAASDDASVTFRLVAACYDPYLDLLDREALYDDAMVFRWATERVRTTPVPRVTEAVVAVCDGVDLPPVAHAFLDAVRMHCRAFYRVGASDPTGAPPQTAADRFPDAARPPVSEAPAAVHVQTCRAVGATNEVKAAVRDLLDRDAPLDDVEIAVAGDRPYLSLIADQMTESGVPVSIGPGLPAAQTRTGTALLSFFEWITEDFDPAILIRMLRSGHVRLDRIQDADSPADGAPHEVATRLAARRYEPGRRGYDTALRHAIDRKTERIDDLTEKGLDPAQTKTERAHLEHARSVVDALLDLAPREASVPAMARMARTFIERFGPVDPPPDDLPETERTLDEAARSVLWERVDRLTRLPVDGTASGRRLAALFRRWLDRQRVRAERPRPGAVHVVPLDSAGYGGRSHLYVVGMDSDTLQTAERDDALLRDADRRVLNDALDGVLPERSETDGRSQWRYEQALRRHSGSLHLYARTFDVERGEERYPSALFLGMEAAANASQDDETRLDGFVPRNEQVLLSDAEAWLAAYRQRTASPDTTAREALQTHAPWVRDGEQARQERRSDTYTTHDGLLSDADPDLDFLRDGYGGPPMSAGRLQTLAETPYLYFLQYVLDVAPLDEPAIDEEPWLNPLRRGTILHDTFKTFMQTLDDRDERPTREHEPLLREVLNDRIEEETAVMAPSSPVVEASARRRLLADARIFLRSEAAHCQTHTPVEFEAGFGHGPYRRKEGDRPVAPLTVGEQTLPLRGRIDRIDRRPDGQLVIWDYKTGSTSGFDDEKPLKQGVQLQWALYAYAHEALTDDAVARSGYFFTSVKEMGTRLTFDPARYRSDVEKCLEALGRLARTGSFPMHPRAKTLNPWKYRGYARLFRSLTSRSQHLKAKAYPDDRPVPPSFDG